jgi:hypothetical protein
MDRRIETLGHHMAALAQELTVPAMACFPSALKRQNGARAEAEGARLGIDHDGLARSTVGASRTTEAQADIPDGRTPGETARPSRGRCRIELAVDKRELDVVLSVLREAVA